MCCLSGSGKARSGGNFFSGAGGCSDMLFDFSGRGVGGRDLAEGKARAS